MSHHPADYGPWIILVRMWSCVRCHCMLSGRESRCPHCLTSREPEILDLA